MERFFWRSCSVLDPNDGVPLQVGEAVRRGVVWAGERYEPFAGRDAGDVAGGHDARNGVLGSHHITLRFGIRCGEVCEQSHHHEGQK